MSAEAGDTEQEKQPLQQSEVQDEAELKPVSQPDNSKHDPNLTGQSLIRHTDDNGDNDLASPYQVDPTRVTDAYENPYRETTDNSQNFIRRVPSSDLVPSPFKKFRHLLILSIVALTMFLPSGFFAMRLAKAARTHHSKGLYGLAQRDAKKSVILSYLSIVLGILGTIAFIVLLASL
ncbi:hypothetical protein ACF0H5_007187 [Mactra antiquata]